jgi:hypothetical protein
MGSAEGSFNEGMNLPCGEEGEGEVHSNRKQKEKSWSALCFC